mgnify:CR=1 FL=1
MEYGSKEYNDILKQFKQGNAWMNDVSVEIINDVNALNPLVLLKAYEDEPTVESSTALASQMVMNKEVQFKKSGKVVYGFTYNGGDLSDKFIDAPYFLNLLLKLCYGIMIKKLTPPSSVSELEGEQSAPNL